MALFPCFKPKCQLSPSEFSCFQWGCHMGLQRHGMSRWGAELPSPPVPGTAWTRAGQHACVGPGFPLGTP